MLIVNHVLAGALIGGSMDRVGSAFAAGVGSHAMMDVVPHYLVPHEHGTAIAVIDGLLGLATVAATLAVTPPARRLRVAAGIAGACTPDLDKPGRMLVGRSPFPAVVDRFHARMQTELPQLIGVELGTAVALTALVGRALRRAR